MRRHWARIFHGNNIIIYTVSQHRPRRTPPQRAAHAALNSPAHRAAQFRVYLGEQPSVQNSPTRLFGSELTRL